jgi:hypothetical protein
VPVDHRRRTRCRHDGGSRDAQDASACQTRTESAAMTTRQIIRVAGNGALGGIVGFLMRPCCVIPAVLSLLGATGVGLAEVTGILIDYRRVLLSISVLMLAASLSVTFRTDGGWPAKIVSATAAILAFVFVGMGSL